MDNPLYICDIMQIVEPSWRYTEWKLATSYLSIDPLFGRIYLLDIYDLKIFLCISETYLAVTLHHRETDRNCNYYFCIFSCKLGWHVNKHLRVGDRRNNQTQSGKG